MDASKLKEYDNELSLLKPGEGFELSSISPLDYSFSNSLYFIGDKKQLKQDFKEKNICLVLDKKMVDGLDEKKLKTYFEDFDLVYQSSSFKMSLCKFSKYFYDLACLEDQDMVDARQMGKAEIHPDTWIGQNVFIGNSVVVEEGVKIYPGVVILSGSKVGKNSTLYPNVSINRNVRIGENCRIHSGTVLGSDGFGYHFESGIHHKIWHYGGVRVESNVEIGANSCIDGGTFVPTLIGEGSKLDNHVQIGHNVEIGRAVVLCGHVAIGGSSRIGDYTVFGGKAAMGDNLSLGAQCQVAGGAGVNCSWPDKSVIGGHPARPVKEWMRGIAYIRKESLKK